MVALLTLACQRGALMPDGSAEGGHGSGGGPAGAGGVGPAGSEGTGAAGAGGGGGTGEQACATIQPSSDSFASCGRTTSLAYSPDGQWLAAGMDEPRPNVHLWRIADGVHVRAIDGIDSVTYQVAFSPDGTTLATVGASARQPADDQQHADIVKLWDVATGSLLRTIPANCGFYASTVSFSHDGTLLATAGYVGMIEIWRVADGVRVIAIPYPTSVHNVHFSPTDSQLIAGGVDRRATIWNVKDGSLAMTLDGTADEMADAAFSPDGREIATTGVANVIKIWNGAGGSLRQALPGHGAYVSHVLWVNQDLLASNDWQGTIILWQRTSAGDLAPSESWATGGQSLGIAVSPDRRMLAAGGADPVTHVEGFYFIPL